MTINHSYLADIAGSVLFTDTDSIATVAGVAIAPASLHSIDVDNTANAAVTYTRIWDLATGSVTNGTTAPSMVIMTPASSRVCTIIPQGLAFGTAITIASGTTGGTAGTTSPTSDVVVRIVTAP